MYSISSYPGKCASLPRRGKTNLQHWQNCSSLKTHSKQKNCTPFLYAWTHRNSPYEQTNIIVINRFINCQWWAVSIDATINKRQYLHVLALAIDTPDVAFLACICESSDCKKKYFWPPKWTPFCLSISALLKAWIIVWSSWGLGCKIRTKMTQLDQTT